MQMPPSTVTARPLLSLYKSVLIRLRLISGAGQSAVLPAAGRSRVPLRDGVNEATWPRPSADLIPKPADERAWSSDAGAVATVTVDPTADTEVTCPRNPCGVAALTPAVTTSPAASFRAWAGGLVNTSDPSVCTVVSAAREAPSFFPSPFKAPHQLESEK